MSLLRGTKGLLMLGVALSMIFAGKAPGQSGEEKKAGSEGANTSVEITYDDEKKAPPEETEFTEPIEQIFKNPALANGLASSAEAINRSVESLMDALFYSILDNELRWDLTDDSWFSLNLQRDVFSTASGAYVIVDRMGLGPRYARELGRVANLPINLGIDGTVEVLQIYLRTDGMRVAENQRTSWWRYAVNNWFGLLPLASALLPPSFNPNELYDPIRQLETPFVFPFDVEGFYEMPVGSIRSYAVSGGVHLALSFDGALDQKSRDILEALAGIEARMPYTVFKRGEHRINVLRRGENIAWVGVNESNRTGHSLDMEAGNKIFVLSGALAASFRDLNWVWNGVPGLFFPLDAKFEQAIADLYDQVYEYDLSNPHAQDAYAAAVKGDFTLSRSKYLDNVEQGVDTGVTFHFTRNQARTELSTASGPNIAVYRNQREQQSHKAEIEITDQEGRFYVLEARQATKDENWDVLVGQEDTFSNQIFEIKVRRVYDKAEAEAVSDPEALSAKDEDEEDGEEGEGQDEEQEPKPVEAPAEVAAAIAASDADPGYVDDQVDVASEEPEEEKSGTKEELVGPPKAEAVDPDLAAEEGKYTYAFAVDEEPVRMVLTFDIQDRYVTALELSEYLEEIRFVTALPIRDVPRIGYRDPDLLLDRRRTSYFTPPGEIPVDLHVTPTYLGAFGAKAAVSFSTREIKRIVETDEDLWWASFGAAFGKDGTAWGDPSYREGLTFQSQWFPAFFALPLRLFNIRFPAVDAIAEITEMTKGLSALRAAKTPMQWLAAANQLFNTDYPKELMHGLLLLSNLGEVPRRVTFSAQPKGSARHGIKMAYKKLNGRVFEGGKDFPPAGRYARSKKKLSAFYLDQPRELGDKPRFSRIQVSTRSVPESVRQLQADPDEESKTLLDRDVKHIYMRLAIEGLDPAQPAKIYVRVEQAGKIKIGKLELAEKVLELSPVEPSGGGKLGELVYEFFLTGPLSPLSNFVFDQAVASGDQFLITLAAASDATIWSDEKTVEIRFEKGMLMPPE